MKIIKRGPTAWLCNPENARDAFTTRLIAAFWDNVPLSIPYQDRRENYYRVNREISEIVDSFFKGAFVSQKFDAEVAHRTGDQIEAMALEALSYQLAKALLESDMPVLKETDIFGTVTYKLSAMFILHPKLKWSVDRGEPNEKESTSEK